MTVLFRDVHDGLEISNQCIEGLSFSELLYADDTALITTIASAMNKLVKKVDDCADHFGLKFNYSKCVAMNYNTRYSTKFVGGDKIPTSAETPYLGVQVGKDHAVRKAISKKISNCFMALQRMQLFWNNNDCPTKFQLQVVDAVIRSKLVYGFESTMLTPALMNKLDTLQLKGLRKILKIKTTYIDRANNNVSVFARANQAKKTLHRDGKDVAPFSCYVKDRQHALLAHTIRVSNDDPLREATLQPDTAYPCMIGKRRVGRPRDIWIWNALEERFILNNLGSSADFRADKFVGADQVQQLAINRTIRL